VALGFERTQLEFDAPGADSERRSSEFFRWVRTGGAVRHLFRLERREYQYGTADLATEDYTVTLGESGQLSPNWAWYLRGNGVRRDSSLADGVEQSAERFALNNRFIRSLGNSGNFDLGYQVSRISTDPGGQSLGQGLSAGFRSPIGAGWHVRTYARFGHLDSDTLTTRTPSANVSFDWEKSRERLQLNATLDSSYAWVETDDGTMEQRERQLGYGASGSIAGGDPSRLRTEFSAELAASEVRLDQEPTLELPDLGFLDRAVGTADSYAARLDFEHRNGGSRLNGWLRWRRQESSPIQAGQALVNEAVTGTVSYNRSRFGLQANGGRTTVERETAAAQDVLHGGASLHWRPWWGLATRISYAVNRRQLTLGPDVDGSRWELNATLELGNLRLESRLFEQQDEVAGGGTRTNRGVRWSISTRFAGWLPIRSVAKRKGVVR
jgi:hypothetical protein